MNNNSQHFFISLLITSLFLILSDILVSTLFPLIGLESFRISIVVLIILYLAFYFNNIFIAPLIAYFYFLHGIFSLEYWSVGVLSCLSVSIIISSLRNIIHLNNKLVTIIFVQLFQVTIYGISRLIIYLKLGDGDFVLNSLSLFIPESIFISLMSPFIFQAFHRIWRTTPGELDKVVN